LAEVDPELVALTGATGFVGRHLAGRLRARGLRVRALVRRDDPGLDALGVELVCGDLANEAALEALVAGVGTVVHAAGLVRARRSVEFESANVRGTARLAEATRRRAEGARFVLVSSLAARAPAVSAYARSKRRAEEELRRRADGLRATILRPPALYGPGDRATFPILAQLARGFLVAPRAPANRFSLLFVDDLAELLAELVAEPNVPAGPFEPDDGTPGGYTWRDLAERAAERTGRRVRLVELPRSVLAAAAWLAEIGARPLGAVPPLSRGKVAELFHPDWRATDDGALWRGRARTTFAEGFERTLAWYRREGWL
jgi:nucleoside-diphosphate-sugar epimerase